MDKELAAKREELRVAQQGLYDGTLQNPHHIKALKKEIARLLTKINAPAPVEKPAEEKKGKK